MKPDTGSQRHLPRVILVGASVLVAATLLSFFVLFMQSRQQEHFLSGRITNVSTSTITITSARGERTTITVTPHTVFLQGSGTGDFHPGQEIMSRGNFIDQTHFIADGVRLLRH